MQNVSLARSRVDRKIAGVCGGIAETWGFDPTLVRVIAVGMLVFTSAPVFAAYVVAAIVVPERKDGEETPLVDVDWEADALKLTYAAPIAPWSYAWGRWAAGVVGGWTVLCAAAALFLLTVTAGAWMVGQPLPDLSVALPLAVGSWPLVGLIVAAGAARRPYEVVCSHSALRIRRPLRATEDVDLAEVVRVEGDALGVSLTLRTGEQVILPPPPDATALQLLVEQITRGAHRASTWAGDLRQADDARRQVAEVAARGQREGG